MTGVSCAVAAPSPSYPPFVPTQPNLIAEVIGDGVSATEKAACRVARLIEEGLIARGWPAGAMCGSEQTLAETFGVGRAVIREAVRILEMRGTARMVPGPRGGLHVCRLDRGQVADFLVGYATFVGIDPAQCTEAGLALDRVRANGADMHGAPIPEELQPDIRSTLGFFDEIIAAMTGVHRTNEFAAHRASVLFGSHGAPRRSRAAQIADRMLSDCTLEQWMDGHRLGSEEDLCFRYDVDRDAFRQAVRILESTGAAQTICGRGHGLVSKAPREGSLARLVSCLFASEGVRPSAVMLIFEQLSVEMIALSAAKATPDQCDRVDEALAILKNALAERDCATILAAVFEVERRIFIAAGNPLMELLACSLRGYPSVRIPRDLELLNVLNHQFLSSSAPIAAALRANDVKSAIRNQLARARAIANVSRRFGSSPTYPRRRRHNRKRRMEVTNRH